MMENAGYTKENFSVIETAIGPLDMTEIVDGYGEKEGVSAKSVSIKTENTNSNITKSGDTLEGAVLCGDVAGEGVVDEAMAGFEKFPLPLNVYGEEVKISIEEATRAIERGLDFDKVNDDLFAAKNDDRLLMLSQIAKDTGKTGAQLLARLHKDCLMETLEAEYGELDNVPREKLAEIVGKLSCLEKIGEQIPLKEKQLEMREQLSEFHRQNPEVLEIPEVVLEGVKEGMPLYKAYDIYRINELESKVCELTREITLSRQKKVAEQIEVPSLSGASSCYSTGEEDVYAFFKKMW